MRKVLLSLAVLGGLAAASGAASAAPVPLAPVVAGPAQVQPVQYVYVGPRWHRGYPHRYWAWHHPWHRHDGWRHGYYRHYGWR